MNTVEGECPNCGAQIVIPESVTQYVCICGEWLNVIKIEKTEQDDEKQEVQTTFPIRRNPDPRQEDFEG